MQAGLVKILQAIYEQDIIDDSHGFRPGRGCHNALRVLSQTVEGKIINAIVEADIKGFFDNVDQESFFATELQSPPVRYNKLFLLQSFLGTSKNPDFIPAPALRKKFLAYISTICCAEKFFPRLAFRRTMNF